LPSAGEPSGWTVRAKFICALISREPRQPAYRLVPSAAVMALGVKLALAERQAAAFWPGRQRPLTEHYRGAP